VRLLKRIEHLEKQFGQSDDDMRLVTLTAEALRGNENARVQLIDLYHRYSGCSHLPDLVRISGLLEGPIDPITHAPPCPAKEP
jgi:hypothetical protein